MMKNVAGTTIYEVDRITAEHMDGILKRLRLMFPTHLTDKKIDFAVKSYNMVELGRAGKAMIEEDAVQTTIELLQYYRSPMSMDEQPSLKKLFKLMDSNKSEYDVAIEAYVLQINDAIMCYQMSEWSDEEYIF